ncbi:hypothetical protein BV25DRAFT_1287154 [Artomyces pyxidatus]|uniref:Uncharacterized protein n=1 Tax=Artomyces pyxidatus TaxID=48021 RepID=A0ACB8SPF1_9AGAM|nr:hypothetical protein BV25DRAFT_1287154 [Artomyces pyxidatus]
MHSMLFTSAALAVLPMFFLSSAAHSNHSYADPCSAIAGGIFAAPVDMLACLRSFPFNETLRQNVMQTVSGVFDFYTFEDFYLDSPPPFQESTTDIRAELTRITAQQYDTDYDFNLDLYNFVNRLNDGHTQWTPNCYATWENLLPTPVVSLEVNGTQGVYIAPDSVGFIDLVPPGFTSFYESIHFDWQRLAGAKVLQIEGMDPYDYVDLIADTVSGNFLDHGVRVNSVFSGYRLSGDSFSQRFGDLAGRLFSPDLNVTFTLIPVNCSRPENVTVPFLATFMGNSFTDSESYWTNNCAANSGTNGVDKRVSSNLLSQATRRTRLQPVGAARKPADGIGLPAPFQPTLPPTVVSADVMRSYLLPDGQTGVLFVGSFDDDIDQFQIDASTAITTLKAAGATRLLIDLTNNLGGFICLGFFLHQYLAGSSFGYPGFDSAIRANPLAQKIVAADIAQDLSEDLSFYVPDQYAFLNNTILPADFDYVSPAVTVTINGQPDPTSRRFHDVCSFSVPIPDYPPFNLSNVAIVNNGNCASTCAMFSTLMNERHNTTIAVFGGKPGENVEFKGMAGNQVLEWTDLDSEIKTAGLKDDPLAPPDLLVSANMRHNWRTAYSYLDESEPIAYVSELPKLRFPYTLDTYNNPQNVWIFTAQQIFG